MSKNLYFAIFAILIAPLQVACVAKTQPVTCTFTGEKHLPAGMTKGEICPSFEARLAAALESSGADGKAGDLIILVELNARGTLEATVKRRGDEGDEKLPNIAIDVMDRDIQKKDFDQLADTLAQVMLKQ